MPQVEISGEPPVCIRCRGFVELHEPWCEVVAFRSGMASYGLMQLEEQQIAKRYRVSARVVHEAGEIAQVLS